MKPFDKAKHVIYYSNQFGRNDGPPLYYLNVMKNQLKWDVSHSLPIGDTLRVNGPADYHWWVDWGEDGLMPFYQEWYPPKDRGKTIYIASDTHLGKEYRFDKAKKFDYAFFNQKHAKDEFNRQIKQGGKKSHYLSHAAEPQAYPHFEILKKYDFCFIGHLQDKQVGNFVDGKGVTRIDALDRMFREFPNFYFGSRTPLDPKANMFEDASRKFCMSRVVFNISIGNDLNMRFFEVLSSGSFLLTNWIPELENIKDQGLIAGKHFETYKTLDEAVKKTKYFLKHEQKRDKIAEAGHKAFMEGHTYKHRILKIEKVINS